MPLRLRDKKILVVEDDPLIATALAAVLGGTLAAVESVTTLAEARARLGCGHWDVVLLDTGLPDSQGAATVAGVREACPECPIVVLSADNCDGSVAAAYAAGAQDFLVKCEWDSATLLRSILYAIQTAESMRVRAGLKEEIEKLKKRPQDRELAETIGRLEGWADAATR